MSEKVMNLAELVQVEDMFQDTISKEELKELKKEKEFGDVPSCSIVNFTIYGEPYVAVYRNNGQVVLEKGTEFGEIMLTEDYFVGEEVDWNKVNQFWKNNSGNYADFLEINKIQRS